MATLLHTINQIIELIDCREHSVSTNDADVPTLSPEEFEYLSELLDVALEHNPEDALLWFWRGWADQMLEVRPDWRYPHPNFEKAEDAYLHALTIQPNHGPAAMMLTVLYLDAALFNAAWRTARKEGFASWDEVVGVAELYHSEMRVRALRALRGTAVDSPEPRVDPARGELAYNIVWRKPTLTRDELAEAQKYASMWLKGSGAEIVEQVYQATWIYDDEPIAAFHTDYIGWLGIVEGVVRELAPDGQVGRLLYELTDAWVEDPNHPVRGEFYGRALHWSIEEPIAFFDCLIKAVSYLSDTGAHEEWIQDLIRAGVEWLGHPSHLGISEYHDLRSEFAEALVGAIQGIGSARTMAAIAEGITAAAEKQTIAVQIQEPPPNREPSELTRVLMEMHEIRASQERAEQAQQRTEQAVHKLYDLLYESLGRFENSNNREAEAERFAERAAKRLVWIEQIVRYFDGDLKQAPLDFQRDVIVGEALFDYCRSTGQDNYALVVFHWGKLTEIWLRRALLVPFGRWLDAGPQPPSLLHYGSQRSPLERAEVPGNRGKRTWEATFKNKNIDEKWHADDFLEVAADDRSSPMANYLNHLDAEGIIKGARWTRRSDLPAKVEQLRSWRNEAAHENTQIPMSVAQECHDILWKKGLMRDLCRLAVAAEVSSR